MNELLFIQTYQTLHQTASSRMQCALNFLGSNFQMRGVRASHIDQGHNSRFSARVLEHPGIA